MPTAGAAAEERRRAKASAARGEPHQAEPQRVARTAALTGISSPGSLPLTRAGDRHREEDRDARDDDHDDVPGQLLERDPAPARSAPRPRTRGCPAAPPRRASPDSARIDHRLSDDREERAVLVLDVAAQRLDVDRLAGEALEDRRHGSRRCRRAPCARRAWRTRSRWPRSTLIRSRTSKTATMIVARRESRSVLPIDAAGPYWTTPRAATAAGAPDGAGWSPCQATVPAVPADRRPCRTGRGTSPRARARG